MAITLTTEELAALKAALVRPVQRVEVGDMAVTYPSIRDVWSILNSDTIAITDPLIVAGGQGGRTWASFGRE